MADALPLVKGILDSRTDAGRAHLAAGTAQWVRYAATVTDVLTAAPGPA